MTASQAPGSEPAVGAARAANALLSSFAVSVALHAVLLYALANEDVGLRQVGPGLVIVRLATGASGLAGVAGRGMKRPAAAKPASGAQDTRSSPQETRPELRVAHATAVARPTGAQSAAVKAATRSAQPVAKVDAREAAHESEVASKPAFNRDAVKIPSDTAVSPGQLAKGTASTARGASPVDDGSRLASSGPAGGSAAYGIGPEGSGDGGLGRGSYYRLLSAWLERHKHYPDLARRRGLEGTASLRVAIRRDGSVISAALQAPSRHDVLDRAALDLVRRAAPFPQVPSDVAGDRFEFVVPIHFHLDRRG